MNRALAQLAADLAEMTGLPHAEVAATITRCTRRRVRGRPLPLRCALGTAAGAEAGARDRGAPPALRPSSRAAKARRRDPETRRRPDGPARVVAKERISIDEAGFGANVTRHVEIILAHLADNPSLGRLIDVPGSPRPDGTGHFPNGVLVDNNLSVSATSRHKVPPEHQRLMQLVSDWLVDVVLTTALSRLWRSATAMRADLEVMKSRGITIVCTGGGGKGAGTYDLTSKEGDFLVTIVIKLAEMEAELSQERSRATMLLAASRGAYHGSHNFGYQLAYKVFDEHGIVTGVEPGIVGKGAPRAAERRTLLPLWAGPDHEAMAAYRLAHGDWPEDYKALLGKPIPGTRDMVGESDLVVEMAQRIDADEPLYQIAKDFDRRGIRTKTGKTWAKVGNGSIVAIVTAERNAGWRRHLVVDYNPVEDVLEISHEGMEVADWPPILDRALWDRIVKKLDPQALRDDGSGTGRMIPRRTNTSDNKLKHLPLRFAVCDGEPDKHPGREVTMKSGHITGVNADRLGRGLDGKGRVLLICPECGRHRDMEDVEAKMVRYMTAWMSASGDYDTAVARQRTKASQARATLNDAKLAELRELKAKLEGDLDAMDENLGDRTWTKAKYNKQVARKQEQIAEVDAQLPAGPPPPGDPLEDWPQRGLSFAKRWKELEAKGQETLWQRRRVAEVLIGKVVILAAPRGTPPGRGPQGSGQHHRADDAYTVVYPGDWWPDWQPEALPLTLDEMVMDLLKRPGGAWTRAEIAKETGIHFDSLHRVLKRLAAAGELIETWERGRSAEGRATFTYRVG